ncbi:MAG TPA: hypothetical protein VGN33_14850 [Leifsonia sp.]|jgi:hypothetical protein|nr:hypothetical protein [Leifsonia sp.]
MSTLVMFAQRHATSGTDPVAIVALFVALLSLGWNILSLFLRWPRFAADLTKGVIIYSDRVEHIFGATVTNLGSEAATVWDVGLDRRTSERIASASNERANGRKVEGPDLPTRIEPHETLVWLFPDRATRGHGDSVEMVSYVQRFRPRRWFSRKRTEQLKAYRSQRSLTRA